MPVCLLDITRYVEKEEKMKKANTIMLTAIAALCLTSASVYAEGKDVLLQNEQQLEYRMPMGSESASGGAMNLSTDQIEQAQKSLRKAGHDIKVDGLWGPETAGAVLDFQSEKDLSATGKLDQETLAALEVTAK